MIPENKIKELIKLPKKISINIEVIDDEQWLISIKSGREIIGKKTFKECPTKVELEKYIGECVKKHGG